MENDGELGKSKCVELDPSQHHNLGVPVLSWGNAGFPMGAAATVQLSAPLFQPCVGTGFVLGPGGRQGAGTSPGFASDITFTW